MWGRRAGLQRRSWKASPVTLTLLCASIVIPSEGSHKYPRYGAATDHPTRAVHLQVGNLLLEHDLMFYFLWPWVHCLTYLLLFNKFIKWFRFYLRKYFKHLQLIIERTPLAENSWFMMPWANIICYPTASKLRKVKTNRCNFHNNSNRWIIY